MQTSTYHPVRTNLYQDTLDCLLSSSYSKHINNDTAISTSMNYGGMSEMITTNERNGINDNESVSIKFWNNNSYANISFETSKPGDTI